MISFPRRGTPIPNPVRRVSAAFLLVLCLALPLTPTSVIADELQKERVVFTKIAGELAGQLRGKPVPTNMGTSNGKPKIAVIPFKDEKLPMNAAHGREFNALLVSSLFKIASNRFTIMTQDNLETLIEELIEAGQMDAKDSNAISALYSSNEVDVMIFGHVERVGDELSIYYEAVNNKSETMALTEPRRVPWRSEYGRTYDAYTLQVAVEQAARALATGAPKLRILRLGGVRYENSGELTDLSRYLEESLSIAFKKEYANSLAEKRIRVESIELSPTELSAMHSMEVLGTDLKDENLGAEEGAYTLTGTYWLQGEIIEIRLSLTATGGGSLGWTGGVFESAVGNIALRPEGDFGVWQRKDGMGPIDFTLTTDKGHNPVYRVGETMNLLVQADRDIWLHCYNLQQDGLVFQIFPNRIQTDGKVAGHRLHTIPGMDNKFKFTIKPPSGKELIKCFALGSDVADLLPPVFTQDEFIALPAKMKHDLPGLFRDLGVAMTEQSTVINVVE
jgi:hypothetical protein